MIGDNGSAVDVFIQDQETPPFHYYLMREDKTDIILTSQVNKGDSVINVSPGHGFTATGEYLVLQYGNLYAQLKVKNVATNAITVESPIGNPFPIADTIVIRGVIDLNIDGSSVNQNFVLNFRNGVPIDIQTASISIWNDSAQGDDSTFGDITALTNGLRFVKENTLNKNLGNYMANSDFRDFGATLIYNNKAPSGTYGIDITFDIKNIFGIVLRIDPDRHDILKAVVRDNLSALNRFRISCMGHITQGN